MAQTVNEQVSLASDNLVSWPVKAATKLFKGEIVEKVIGYADSMAISDRGLDAMWGLCEAESDNTSGAAGAINAQVKTGKFRRQITLTNVNEYLVGALVYLVDENTFSLGTTRNPVGRVVQYVTTSTAIVEFNTDLILASRAGLFFEDFGRYLADGFTVTTLGTAGSIASSSTGVYGSLLVTTGATENDGYGLQAVGSHFPCTAAKPLIFGVRVTINDVTQTDFLAGMVITDTDLVGGITDGIWLASADGAATVTLNTTKSSSATASSSIATIVDATAVDLSFVYDGSTKLIPYVNGVAGTAIAVTNLPSGLMLRPSLEFSTGEAVANTCLIKYMIAQQIG